MATLDDYLISFAVEAMDRTRERYPAGSRMAAIAPPWAVRLSASYREVCRLSWALRQRKNLAQGDLADIVGVPRQRISDYLSTDDTGAKRDLPGEHISAFGSALGNSAVTQWLSMRSKLTLVDELQWERENPDLIPRAELMLVPAKATP